MTQSAGLESGRLVLGQLFAPRVTVLAIAALSALSLLSALAFQYLGGMAPCPLCIAQRWAYVAAVGLGVVAVIVDRPRVLWGVLAVLVAAFVYNAGLGVYHSGVEWKWWPGPTDCAGAAADLATDITRFRAALAETRIIRCDEAPFRVLGLSFAGLSALLSAGLAAWAAVALVRAR